MILVDTGPLVGLFDAHDQHHERCQRVLETFDEKLITTVPVLTEALHLLRPGSPGPPRLMGYIRQGGLTVVPLDAELLRRCFELMLQYADTPMDFADASIVCAAEHTRTEKVFTTDRNDFATYRIRRGYHLVPFKIVGDPSGPQLVREGAEETDLVGAGAPLSEEPAG
ncbi:MAG: PIN domain-containing protein [Gemmatimonadota bacterium]|nr:PIN domain-containing protein [Gemmatimonadota bacterium]MDE2866924.1 PIN domain-containing protein [Gemmatimonadota bacterium]